MIPASASDSTTSIPASARKSSVTVAGIGFTGG